MCSAHYYTVKTVHTISFEMISWFLPIYTKYIILIYTYIHWVKRKRRFLDFENAYWQKTREIKDKNYFMKLIFLS